MHVPRMLSATANLLIASDALTGQWCSHALAWRHLEAKFYVTGLGLGLATFGFGLVLKGPGLGLESCIDNFSDVALKLKVNMPAKEIKI